MGKIYRLMVEDQPGVLDRIAGLVRRHAQNISFLLVFESGEKGKSLLIFKLVNGIVDEALSRRITEIESVFSLEVEQDNISENVMKIVR